MSPPSVPGPVPSLYYCNYYEDHYLFPLVVALVKDDAAEMFDFACSNKRGDCKDLGQIV